MRRSRFTYALSTMVFLAVMAWMSVRSYDSMIGRIYTGPLKGFFGSALHPGAKDRVRNFRIQAAVFYSDTTAGSLKDPEKYDGLVASWTRMLNKQRIANEVIDGKGLLEGALRSCNVLILPMATHLSDSEIAAIKQFVSKEGHGLIFSGAAGSRHENGDWRDISLTAEIIGGENIQEVAQEGGSVAYMILDGRNPLSTNIPPGLRLGVNTYDRPVSASLLEPRTETAGYWEESNRSRGELSTARTGIASGRYRGGRFVWTGFTLGSEIDPFGLKVGEILLRNMLDYAAFQPLFAKEPWPNGKQAAVVFAQEVDSEDSAVAASLFQQKQIPCTLFYAANAVQRNSATFKAIAADPLFEIGLTGSQAYWSQPVEKQKEMLLSSKKWLETISGQTIVGFSPFEAQYDANTVTALLESGYSYLAGDPVAWAPPSVLQARKPHYVRIGRDLHLFIKFPHAGLSEEPKTFEQLKQDFDAAYRVGGFYNFSFHSQRLKDAAQAAALAQFMDYLKTRNVWFTTFSRAADWSSRWMLVDVDSVAATKLRSNLMVTNNSPGKIESLRLHVHLPGDSGSLTATSEKLGGVINVIAQQPGKAVLEMRGIGGDSRVFYIDRQP